MPENTEQLNDIENNDTINDETEPAQEAAGGTPEDTASASTDNQNERIIQALMEQNERLTAQLERLIRNGSQIGQQMEVPKQPSMPVVSDPADKPDFSELAKSMIDNKRR